MNVDVGQLPPMNSALRDLLCACWLVMLPVLALARAAAAEEPPVKLVADLIHVKNYPLHVVMEDEKDLLGYRWARMSKAKGLPRVKSPCAVLHEPVFDVSAFMISNGLVLPPGSHALFSPSAELLYVESTAPDLDMARTALSPGPNRAHYLFSLDILVSLQSVDKTEVLLEVKSLHFSSGQHVEYEAKGEGRVQLVMEPIVGPEMDAVDMQMEADIQAHGGSMKKEVKKTVELTKPVEVELGKLGDGTVTLRMQAHLDVDYFGPPALETEAKKATAIEEIQKALHTAHGR
jgi:hypothetical protein